MRRSSNLVIDGNYVGVNSPLPISELPIKSAAEITPHDTNTVTAGRQLLVICTMAGNMKVKLSGGSTITIPIAVGLSVLSWAVIQVYITGTIATATYFNLS